VRGLFRSDDEEFMGRVLEIVLDVPQSALHGWSVQHERSRRARTAERLDAALVKALDEFPQAERTVRTDPPDAEPESAAAQVMSTRFQPTEKMVAAGLYVTLEASQDGRRVVICQQTCYSPGVKLREILYEAPLDADAPVSSAFAAAPEKCGQVLADAGDLAPLTTLACERDGWQWAAADGIVVDIALNRFLASTGGDASPTRELCLTTAFVDDLPGPALTALFAAACALVVAVPAFPVLRTALDRVSNATDVPEATEPARATPIDLAGISTPHAALIAIGRNLADQWFGNDAGVRDAVSTEFVHQMRISQRRLRTALRIFPHWEDDAWKTRVAPDLKWLGTVLGEARDWDVFVDSSLPALAAADADSARWTAICESANARRLEAREGVQTAMGSARYAQLALAWLEWLSGLPSREPPATAADTSLRAYAQKRVHKYYKRLIGAPKLTTLDESARHKERIQAKYLRYTLEFFESIASQKTRKESSKTVARMQAVLGDGNDAAVALRYLQQIDAPPYQSGFAHGWCEASKRYTAQAGERLLRKLRKPKITGGAGG
jgi:CHAD domain-containing protein